MNRQEIKEALENYYWMIQTLSLYQNETAQKMTAQYGIEATLPKPQGNHTDPLFFEVARREKSYAGMKKIEEKVRFIQERMYLIKNPKHLLILNKILNGDSLRSISRDTSIPLTNIRRIRDEIANKMYLAQPAQVAQ